VKRLLLHRSVREGAAGETVEVVDSVARVLLGCPSLGEPPSAELVADLGPDERLLPVAVRILKPCSAGGGPVAVGETVRLSERDARLLVSLGRAEIVGGALPAVVVPAGVDSVAAAAVGRLPLDQPLRKGGSR
jgi:hypothetical protein